MYFKFIGAACVILACGLQGYMLSCNHHSKIKTADSMVALLDYMICELRYRGTPLPILCRQAGTQVSGKIGKRCVALADELDAQISPNVERCMAVVLDQFCITDRSLYNILNILGRQMGSFDLTGQLQGLTYCRDLSQAELERLTDNKDIRVRSYQTLGLCAGAALVIFFV